MKRPKIFLAIPTYGGMEPRFVKCLLAMLTERRQMELRGEGPGFDLQIEILAGDSLIPRARNTLAAAFLRSDCTHLLFLDSDLIFRHEQIARLVSHQKAIVCGLYPKKDQHKLGWVCNLFEAGNVPPDKNGLQPVKYAGTGCMLIARCILDEIVSEFGEFIRYDAEDGDKHGGWDFFSVGSVTFPEGGRRYLSEDWYFCQRLQDMGHLVIMDTRVVLPHVGTAVYPLQDVPTVDQD